ncbi:MAG: hypothetical protein RIQ75_1818 [Pseudomonadota bacterium]
MAAPHAAHIGATLGPPQRNAFCAGNTLKSLRLFSPHGAPFAGKASRLFIGAFSVRPNRGVANLSKACKYLL